MPLPIMRTGNFNAYGKEGPAHDDGAHTRFKVLSINVTALTKARLGEVLDCACGDAASAVALQETRHLEGGFPWASRLAAKQGWKVQWSRASPKDWCGHTRAGGTALLWRAELGRGEPLIADHGASTHCMHRSCGRRWADFDIWSVYGDAQKADLRWFGDILRAAQRGPNDRRPTLVVGDFNWREAYGKALVDDWRCVDRQCSVKKGSAAPTRCIFQGA